MRQIDIIKSIRKPMPAPRIVFKDRTKFNRKAKHKKALV